MTYSAPVLDMKMSLLEAAQMNMLAGRSEFSNYDPDLVDPILEEANKLASEVLAPINQSGDKTGAKLVNGDVIVPDGFKDAYQAYREGGWLGLCFPEEWGGQGLPRALALSVMEMVHASNMSFGLCPLLSLGAVEALLAHGSDELKRAYLPKLISGEWTGTMNLTEPQAGSDVGALKSKATPQDDGSYRIEGQKIYITWGDHDCTDNIVHLVLARLPDAPAGSRGVSLFLVPKFLLDENGQPSERNDLRCIGLEEKIGIHASPTCVMEYGGNGGAVGWLIGEENRGLACMFTMMNSARLNVGLQGVAVGDAAYQAALAYAKDRVQGKARDYSGTGSAPIIYHPDVRRNLLSMRARVMAGRAICYACAFAADDALSAETEEARTRARLREELLTPIAKAWCTDMGVDATSIGVQVHGGMGYMNETLAAQLYRDSRITPIYEGTNGIQAGDLVGRKLSMADGAAMSDFIADIRELATQGQRQNDAGLAGIAKRLEAAVEALSEATEWMREQLKAGSQTALASSAPYLALSGDVAGGFYLLKAELNSRQGSKNSRPSEHERATIAAAKFYAENILSRAPGLLAPIISGAETVLAESDALFDIAPIH